jgi:Flp pilus assembly protein TadG
MVEAALTLIVFLMVFFGIVGFGRAIWAYSWVSHAAREGARWASVRGSKGAEVATATSVQDFVKNHMLGLNAGHATVATSWPTDNNPGSTVVVMVTYDVTQVVPWVPAISVQSTSKMSISQ